MFYGRNSIIFISKNYNFILNHMPTFDLFIAGFLALFVIFGFGLGFIRLIGSFFGIIIGIWLAGRYYEGVASWFVTYIQMSENLSRVAAFIIIFLIISKIISLIFKLLDRIFKILSIIPFTKAINRLAGAVLGAIEGLLILALLIFLFSRYAISPQIDELLKASHYAPFIAKFIFPLWPLLPEMLKNIKALI